ncbi:metallophosphoesterase [Candidatus Woesearchaeota archaeon]|nr:metallophosphoesterase [Candidatus Woesearchaeota archaeon]
MIEKGVLVEPEIVETGLFDSLSESQQEELLNEDLEILSRDLLKKIIGKQKESKETFEIIYDYKPKQEKIDVNMFVKMFNNRYRELEKILLQRSELEGVMSINRIKSDNEGKKALIGMVLEISETKNKNIILTMEDPTGTINAIVSKSRKDLYFEVKDLVRDEVIGLTGSKSGEVIFVNSIINPDTPLSKELKKSPKEEYVIFIGDPHYGSKVFLEKEFKKMISWLNGQEGTEELKNIAAKVKYCFITGDLIEGIGIYPNQEKDLLILDIEEQYEKFTDLIKNIPQTIQVFIIPGNHDAGRIAEPQPSSLSDFAPSLKSMKNVHLLSNPCLVKIAKHKNFSGIDVLLYHGYSLPYFADTVESIRNAGGMNRTDLIMKFLLQRRHLAPTHSSNMYVPSETDDLVIKTVPDIFVTGHIHKVSVGSYRNITTINASCWGDVTDDQIKRGIEPQPARLVVCNLKTREVKIINFLGKRKK